MKRTPEIDAIMAKALAQLDAPIPVLEFDSAEMEFDLAGLGLNVPFDPANDVLNFDPSAAPPLAPPVPVPAPTGSRKISLRVPARILSALKARAAATGIPYQRLLNRVLRDAVRGWGAV